MSSFTKPLRLEFKSDSTFDLLEEFYYYTHKIKNDDGTDFVIQVPKGFNTDFASIPRIFRSLFPVLDKHAKAAVIHDYLYDNKFNKYISDKVFYEAMKVLGVSLWKRSIMFAAVRSYNFIADLLKKIFRRK